MNWLKSKLMIVVLSTFWMLFLTFVYNWHVSTTHSDTRRNEAMKSLYFKNRDKISLNSQPVKQSKILCWVLTQPQNLKKVTAIKNTWGRRCDKTLYFSSVANDTFPLVKLDVLEGRKHLPNKTAKAFTYCYHNYINEFDWFLKADDDTYIIVENLRKFVSNLSASDPLYFGHNFFRYFNQGYMSGGAGYVLSREGLKRFVTQGLVENSVCKLHDVANEDVLVGSCLERLKVKAVDTVDEKKRERFLPLDPLNYLITGWPFWLPDFSKFKPKKGKDCCARDLISLHYVHHTHMYLYDFLIYGVKVSTEFSSENKDGGGI